MSRSFFRARSSEATFLASMQKKGDPEKTPNGHKCEILISTATVRRPLLSHYGFDEEGSLTMRLNPKVPRTTHLVFAAASNTSIDDLPNEPPSSIIFYRFFENGPLELLVRYEVANDQSKVAEDHWVTQAVLIEKYGDQGQMLLDSFLAGLVNVENGLPPFTASGPEDPNVMPDYILRISENDWYLLSWRRNKQNYYKWMAKDDLVEDRNVSDLEVLQKRLNDLRKDVNSVQLYEFIEEVESLVRPVSKRKGDSGVEQDSHKKTKSTVTAGTAAESDPVLSPDQDSAMQADSAADFHPDLESTGAVNADSDDNDSASHGKKRDRDADSEVREKKPEQEEREAAESSDSKVSHDLIDFPLPVSENGRENADAPNCTANAPPLSPTEGEDIINSVPVPVSSSKKRKSPNSQSEKTTIKHEVRFRRP